MPDTLKVLGQSAPNANVLQDIYVVPAGTGTTVSTIAVCNRSATPTTFRISIAVAGVPDSLEQYLYYDVPIPGNDTFIATVGLCLGAGDRLRVTAGAATLSFQAFGVEVS